MLTREIIGTVTGVIVVLYFMYWMYPMLNSEHTQFANFVNTTDPIIVTSYSLGTVYYNAIPLIVLLAAAFMVIVVALKRGPDA